MHQNIGNVVAHNFLRFFRVISRNSEKLKVIQAENINESEFK
jgi:hypothetical protein